MEIRPLLQPDFFVLSLADIGGPDDLPETQNSFAGNALQKATFVNHNFNIICFADDSGLEVDALGGAPGIYSARYAGPQKKSDDNIDLLLNNLTGKNNRTARFRTVIALVGSGDPKFFEGVIEGTIIHERRGNQGFGYDPVFIPEGSNKTFAEMTLEEKNSLSHRAIAVRKLIHYLKTTTIG